jgi:nitrite reductase/ring-hydroxylating ferredoxin subunit
MAFTKVAQVSDVPQGKAKQISVNGKTVALFNVNGNFFAIDNECPHRGGPLAEGEVDAAKVTCPWHGAAFDVTSGACLAPPARTGVTTYKVQVVGQDVQVDV